MKKSLIAVLIVVILVVIGIISYLAMNAGVHEKFAEFYILGLNGKTENYPTDIQEGKSAQVTVGIVNHEQKVTNYRIEVHINGVKNNEITGITLNPDEKWENPVTFTVNQAGTNQKVEFFLYHDSDVQPYLKPLLLWINVQG